MQAYCFRFNFLLVTVIIFGGIVALLRQTGKPGHFQTEARFGALVEDEVHVSLDDSETRALHLCNRCTPCHE